MVRRTTRAGISVEEGGSGDHLLLLLHGLGATGEVWRRMLPLVEHAWPGRWAVPDLRGHGRSVAEPPYGYAMHAADMAALVASTEAARVTVLGHSFGGVVAAVLAGGWFGMPVERAVALGVHIEWTDDEVVGARALAAKPVKVFATREEAAARHLAFAGLRGLVDPDDDIAAAGVREVEGGWAVALDQRVFTAVGPSVETILDRAEAPLRLAAGSADPMVTLETMRRIDAGAQLIDGAGHNAHWEQPAAVWALIES